MLFVLDLMCQFLLQNSESCNFFFPCKSTGMDACLGILLILFSTADYKLRWVCFKKPCYIHNQQFILVACSFSVLSSSSLLFSLIHLFRVVSRLGFDFCSSFVFSGDSFGRGVEGLEAVRSIASFWFITKHTFVKKFQRGTIKRSSCEDITIICKGGGHNQEEIVDEVKGSSQATSS
ncbi:hypothetical protein PRUPE_1G442000 [Prunus persica]|uniref:Uncharacterized protein n=1 Tax=Prunus persica TaxID=3760 RepID=A0A251RCC7_PRUPE|nr:hypothetical protein PRUPE_1G442000 [Prunus persica]